MRVPLTVPNQQDQATHFSAAAKSQNLVSHDLQVNIVTNKIYFSTIDYYFIMNAASMKRWLILLLDVFCSLWMYIHPILFVNFFREHQTALFAFRDYQRANTRLWTKSLVHHVTRSSPHVPQWQSRKAYPRKIIQAKIKGENAKTLQFTFTFKISRHLAKFQDFQGQWMTGCMKIDSPKRHWSKNNYIASASC